MIEMNEFCYFLTIFGDNECLVVVFEFLFCRTCLRIKYSVNEMRCTCKFAIPIDVVLYLDNAWSEMHAFSIIFISNNINKIMKKSEK